MDMQSAPFDGATPISFTPFPKITRFNREVIVTEKLDGTNAAVVIAGDGSVSAQSRTRVITPEADNFGFAAWVRDHADELRDLGPGTHFGEWWGAGIQRRYGLQERRFSLFNVGRWDASRPLCCHVVPVLWRGLLCELRLPERLEALRTGGSVAAPGFMKPEGVVVFHVASGALFKATVERDDEWKGRAAVAGGAR